MTVRRFFLTPIWLFLSLPCYLGWRLLPPLAPKPPAMGTGIALLIAAALLIPWCIRVRQSRHQKLADALAWVGFTAMGFLSTLFVLTVLRDLVLLGFRGWSGPDGTRLR